MKVTDKTNAITFKCDGCGEEIVTINDIVSLGCTKSSCFNKKVIFSEDVLRRPHGLDAWQKCTAGVAYDSGYLSGTVLSKVYEIKKAEETKEVKKVPESIAQFEEKKPEVKVEEKKLTTPQSRLRKS